MCVALSAVEGVDVSRGGGSFWLWFFIDGSGFPIVPFLVLTAIMPTEDRLFIEDE